MSNKPVILKVGPDGKLPRMVISTKLVTAESIDLEKENAELRKSLNEAEAVLRKIVNTCGLYSPEYCVDNGTLTGKNAANFINMASAYFKENK